MVILFDFLNISKIGENDRVLTVPMLKSRLIKYLDENIGAKEKLKSFKSKGINVVDLDFDHVRHIIWQNKPPKFWPPSKLQIDNMFGRSVLTILLFSIPESFPPVHDLAKFGYSFINNELKHNLNPLVGKEKNARLLLKSILKKIKFPPKSKRKLASERGKQRGVKRLKQTSNNLID